MNSTYTRNDYLVALKRLEKRCLALKPGSFARQIFQDAYDRIFLFYLALEDEEFDRVESYYNVKGDDHEF